MKKAIAMLLCAVLAAPALHAFAQDDKKPEEKKRHSRAEQRREAREKRREANERRREERRERREGRREKAPAEESK